MKVEGRVDKKKKRATRKTKFHVSDLEMIIRGGDRDRQILPDRPTPDWLQVLP